MLSPEDIAYLRGLSVFAGLKHPIVDTIGAHATRVDIPDAQELFRQGDPASEMLVVLRGTLEVVKRREEDGATACIATLGPGDVVGEMSLVDIQPRSADVRTLGPASLAVLKHADLATIYEQDTESYTLLLLNIAREISIRLRRLDAVLADILLRIEDVTRTRDGSRGYGAAAPAGKQRDEE